MGAGSLALRWYYGSSVSGLYDRYIEDPLERELPKTSRGERYAKAEMKRMLVGSTEGADKDTGLHCASDRGSTVLSNMLSLR